MQAKECIVVLDENLSEGTVHRDTTYRINWLTWPHPFDFDRVEIGACSEDVITDFCIAMGNDTDPMRPKKLKHIPCTLLPSARVSKAIRNLLDERFDDIIEKP